MVVTKFSVVGKCIKKQSFTGLFCFVLISISFNSGLSVQVFFHGIFNIVPNNRLYICLTNCKYPVVRQAAKRFGFKIVDEDEDWNLYWTDASVTLDRVLDMKRYQKINHFPGMSEICRKDFLSRNLNRMLKAFPKDYNIFPRSWCLPADYADFQTFSRQHRHKTYILKPDSSCQGKGIWLTKNPSKVSPHEDMVCQVYVTKPYLIDGFKFDLRIYVLVASCDPLRIFVYKEGLARFCTKPYKEPTNTNVDDIYLHLTNYAVQKRSSTFIPTEEEGGTKRRLTTITKYLREMGADVDRLWSDVDDTIIKTIISAYAVLRHNYRTCFPQYAQTSACFEILGFDVIIDHKLRPQVLEVNHSPSFTTDQQIDKDVKLALIYDTLNLANFTMCDKKKVIAEDRKKFTERLMLKSFKKESKEDIEAAEADYLQQITKWEENHLGNFRRIFPLPGKTEKYDRFCTHGSTLFTETAACKARAECSRQQREEIIRKQQQLSKMLRKNPVCPESPERRPNARADATASATQRGNNLPRRTTQSRNARNAQTHYSSPSSPAGSNVVSSSPSSVYQLQTAFTGVAPPSHLPMVIDEQEEISRLSSLMQRENLIRKLGIVDLIRVIVSSASRQPLNHHHSHANANNNISSNNNNAGNSNSQQASHNQADAKSQSTATLAAIQHRLQAEEARISAALAGSSRLVSDPASVLGPNRTSAGRSKGSRQEASPRQSVDRVLHSFGLVTAAPRTGAYKTPIISFPTRYDASEEPTDSAEAVINQDRMHLSNSSKHGSNGAAGGLYNDIATITFGSATYGSVRPAYNGMGQHTALTTQQMILSATSEPHTERHAPPSRGASLHKSNSMSSDLMHGHGIQGQGLGLAGPNIAGINGVGIDTTASVTPKRVRSASGAHIGPSAKAQPPQSGASQLQAVLTGTQLRTAPTGNQQQSAQLQMTSQSWFASGNNPEEGSNIQPGPQLFNTSSAGTTNATSLLVRLPGLGNSRGLMSGGPPQQPLFLPAVLDLNGQSTSGGPNQGQNGAIMTVGPLRPTTKQGNATPHANAANPQQQLAARFKLLS